MPVYYSKSRRFFETKILPRFNFLKNINSLFYFGLFLVVIGIGFYAYSLFTQFWTVPFGGDYTQQQIPLYFNGYDDWHTFFRTGIFPLWDENTFLGADNISSNSFYYLFDPFFVPVLFFPRAWLPQIMAIMLIVKMVTAAFIFRGFLKYMGISEKTARLFSIAYGFIGWTSFYLWYNHFTEIAVIVPLVLFGIEMVLKKGQPWLLVSSIAILGITNYFFLVSACFFGVMYALFRYFQTLKTRKLKQNLIYLGIGILSFAVGLMICSLVVIPGLITAASSQRSEDSTYLSDLNELISSNDYAGFFNKIFFNWDDNNYQFRAFYPLASFFFPTTSNRYVTLFPTSGGWGDLNWASSLFIYSPMMISFFLSIINSIKKHKWSHLIAISLCLIMLFTPFFYYFFFAFSYGYGRWQIFIVIPLLLYAAMGFDSRSELKRRDIIIASIITVTLMLFTFFVARYYITLDNANNPLRDYYQEWGPIIFEFVIISIDIILICGFFKKPYLNKILIGTLALEIIVMGNMVQCFHGTISYSNIGGNMSWVNAERHIYENVISKDKTFYRVQSRLNYQGNDNGQYFVGYNSVGTFHSLYNYNVTDFQRMSDIFISNNTWIGNNKEKKFNFDTFIGVKYYLTYDMDTTYSFSNPITGAYESSIVLPPNVPYGYEQIEDGIEGIRLYKNTKHISLGFSFDTLYYKGNKDGSIYNDFYDGGSYSSVRNEETYLKGAILNNEDVEEILKENKDANFKALNAPTYTDATHYDFYSNYQYRPYKKRYYAINSFTFNPYKTLDYLNENVCTTTVNSNKTPSVIELTLPNNELFINDPNGGYIALKYRLGTGSIRVDADVVLLDVNDNIISYDNHTYPNAYPKQIRGLYADREVKRILILPRSTYIDDDIHVFVETATELESKLDRLNTYPLLDTWNDVNSYGFKTDFENKRMIVLQVPYDKGWRLNITNENGEVISKKIYNAQGGFISFVSEVGECSYMLSFMPYGFDIGSILSITGSLLFGSSIVGYSLYHSIVNKKKRDALVSSRSND